MTMALARDPGSPALPATGSADRARSAWEEAVLLAEAEADRLADELHNGLMQSLVVARHAVGRRPAGAVVADLPDADEAIRDALAETRRVVWHLRPRTGAAGDLAAAVAELTARVLADSGLTLAYEAPSSVALSPGRAAVAYRLVQSLAHAAVAAGSMRLAVRVERAPDGALVVRHDAGQVAQDAVVSSPWAARGAALDVRVEVAG